MTSAKRGYAMVRSVCSRMHVRALFKKPHALNVNAAFGNTAVAFLSVASARDSFAKTISSSIKRRVRF